MGYPNKENISKLWIKMKSYINARLESIDTSIDLAVESVVTDVIANAGHMEMELLWENASPTSAFAAQTVTVNKLEDYKDFAVEWALTSVASYKKTEYFKTGYAGIIIGNAYSSEWTLLNRGFTFENPNKLVFDSSYAIRYTDGSSIADNAKMIPVKIYGIKGVK